MNRNSIIYSYPFAVDIMVALLLFVGRHSLASRGLGEETVGSILFCYGGGYCLSSLFMRKIVRVSHARWQMVAALAAAALASSLLASLQQILLIQILFCLIPFAVSLFFNAFQVFMLDVSHQNAKPLAATAGHYTFSWSMLWRRRISDSPTPFSPAIVTIAISRCSVLINSSLSLSASSPALVKSCATSGVA